MATLADALRGFQPPTTSALADPIKEHFRNLPANFEQNQRDQMAMLARAFPDNTLKNADPKAMAEMAMQVPLTGLTAFHGTPHKILGKFDISKVGTGEGAQAYGHGMYFAENPAVAKEYQDFLGKKISVGGTPIYEANKRIGKTGDSLVDDMIVANLGDIDKSIKMAKEGYQDIISKNPEGGKDFYNAWKKLEEYKNANQIETKSTGNLYKVDIPDEYIPNMLDWDKPLSAQPSIIEKLKGLGDAELNKLGINPDFTRRSTGKELTGESLYDVLTTHNSQKGASNLLAKLEIPGIRYLDQGSRPVAGGEIIDVFKTPEGWKSKIKVTNRNGMAFQVPSDMFTTSMPFKTEAEAKKWAKEKIAGGTSNFVVFDPSTVKILEENGKPLTRKELIEQQINKLD